MPESLERRSRFVGISSDDRCIERTDGYAGHNIRINATFLESLDDAAFKRAECATTLQDKYVLRWDLLKAELRIAQLARYCVQIDPIPDQRFNRFGLLRWPAQRKQGTRYLLLQVEQSK